MEPVHSLCLLKENKEGGYSYLYDKIARYSSENYAVLYAVEQDTTQTIRRMSRHGVDVENLVESGALILANRDEIYSVERTELEAHALMDAWHSLMLRLKKRSDFNGILAIGSAENFFDSSGDQDKLVKYEEIIGKRFSIPLEAVCCYSERAFGMLSLGNLLAILNAHYSTVQSASATQEWNPQEIIKAAKKGIDRVLGGKDTSELFFHTLKLCYRINEDDIVSRPILLERMLFGVLGRVSGERCSMSIKDELRKLLLARERRADDEDSPLAERRNPF